MATVGYGDIVAYSIGEKFMAMFWIVLGACMFAYLMGNMTAMLTSYDPAKAYQLKQEADVQNFVEKRHVPVALAKNITHYYSFKVRREYREDEMAIINGLPNRIKDEVTLHLHKDFVRSIPMFADKTPKFIAEILERLSLDFVQPGDVVVWQGETCLETFFLAEGIIDVSLTACSVDHRLLDSNRFHLSMSGPPIQHGRAHVPERRAGELPGQRGR